MIYLCSIINLLLANLCHTRLLSKTNVSVLSEFSLFTQQIFLLFAAFDLALSQALEPTKVNYDVSFKTDVWEVREKSEQLILEQAVDVVDGINLVVEPDEELEASENQPNEADQISVAKKVLKARILESKSSER